jgi:hypothetical protein
MMAVLLWTADTTIEGFRTRQLSTSKLSLVGSIETGGTLICQESQKSESE